MDRLYTATSLEKWVKKNYSKELKIGFVPTMGALHKGHISLIHEAKKENDVVICSVFVNPTQFNNSDDLEKYPRTLESDIQLLEQSDCDAVFAPTVSEVYPDYPAKTQFIQISIDSLGDVMEGKFRKGHFEGVLNVVYRFFDLIQPHNAYFGLKDFQQVAIIQHMIKTLDLPVNIVACPTLREKSGLAKSSRNTRLSENQKNEALVIFKTLQFGKLHAASFSPEKLQSKMIEEFNKGSLQLEYLEIVCPKTLVSLNENWVPGAVCCIAAYCGEVRLIDNLQLID